jgi:hypothetical protein
MAESQGAGQRRSQKDKEMAARMKREGIQRTTARCGCYRIVTIDSWKSKYTHRCSSS